MLSSVILASLNDARAKARDTLRLQNIHQLETAFNMYANDNGGNFPTTGINAPACLGKASGVSCWKSSGGLVGNDTINSAFSKYIKIPQDPLSNRTSGGDSYLYLNNSQSQGVAVGCINQYQNTPMIVWMPDKSTTNNDSMCKGVGVYACCGSVNCASSDTGYCAYFLK